MHGTYNVSFAEMLRNDAALYNQSTICSSVIENEEYYREKLERNLNALHTFIPKLDSVTYSACWSQNFDLHLLPQNLAKKIRNLSSFANIRISSPEMN